MGDDLGLAVWIVWGDNRGEYSPELIDVFTTEHAAVACATYWREKDRTFVRIYVEERAAHEDWHT